MTTKQLRQAKLAVIAGCFTLTLILLVRFVFFAPDPRQWEITHEYYFDLNTKGLYSTPSGQFPPQVAPSGPKDGQPAGVKAYVFACDDDGCADASKRFIGYLETYTQEGRQLARDPTAGPEALYDKHFIASADAPDQWHRVLSREASRIQSAVVRRCPEGAKINPCYP